MMQCNPWLIIFILITVFLFPFLLYSCSRFCCTPIPIFTVFLLPGNTQSVSEPLYLLFNALYECSNGSCPPEYYYKTCDMMLRLQKDYRPELFDRACAICLENHLFTGKRLENVIKTLVHTSKEIESTATPNPTNHANMRGILFFQ